MPDRVRVRGGGLGVRAREFLSSRRGRAFLRSQSVATSRGSLARSGTGGARTIDEQVQLIGERFNKILEQFEKRGQRRQIGRAAAAEVRKAAREKAPRPSAESKERSKQAKLRGAISARYHGKGSGKIKAWFFAGNLERSMATLIFKRSADVFVGPRFGGSGSSGDFGKTIGTADGYYARMTTVAGRKGGRNFNRRVLTPALLSSYAAAINRGAVKAQQIFEKEKRKQGF